MDEAEPLTPEEMKRIRMQANLNAGFAHALGMTVKAVEAWKAGRNTPSGSSDKILRAIRKHPELIAIMQSV